MKNNSSVSSGSKVSSKVRSIVVNSSQPIWNPSISSSSKVSFSELSWQNNCNTRFTTLINHYEMREVRKSLVIWLFVVMLILPISSVKESASAENASTQISFLYADPGFTDNSLWLISPDWPPYVIGEVGFPLLQKSCSVPIESRWNIAQWGIDPSNPLLVSSKSGRRASWQVQTRDAKVNVSKRGRYRIVDLWHSTENSYYDQQQTCYDPNTFYPSAEFDLFIQPNTPDDPDLHHNFNLPQNFLDHDTTPPLSQIDQLYLQAQQRLADVATSYRCGYDSAVTLLAVVFINTVGEPVQVLYYQLTTFDTRWPNQNTDGWFYNGEIFEGIANYGYDDSITNGYNLRPLVRRRPWRKFNLNIRDRVAHLIETSQHSIDKDLSHWKVHSMYAGSIIFGKGHIESELKGINLLMTAR